MKAKRKTQLKTRVFKTHFKTQSKRKTLERKTHKTQNAQNAKRTKRKTQNATLKRKTQGHEARPKPSRTHQCDHDNIEFLQNTSPRFQNAAKTQNACLC